MSRARRCARAGRRPRLRGSTRRSRARTPAIGRGQAPGRGCATTAGSNPRAVGFNPRSRIAVLYAVGAIVSGRSGVDPLNGDTVGSDTLIEQIRQVRGDDSIKAIVLRVDSPGGSSVASDVIWRELMITRDQKPSRPLVTSMSDLAASGGYYIAAAGSDIVAQPGTLTGSIGIYAGKMAVGGTLAKLGVSQETVKSGAQRRHLLAIRTVHARSSGTRCRRSSTTSTAASSEGGTVAAHDARADRCGGARAGLDRQAGARARPGRQRSAASTRRSRWPSSGRRFRQTRMSSWCRSRRGAASTRR